MCPTLPRRWRRTRADPVPPRAYLVANDGAIPRLHATNWFCRKRQNRNRAGALSSDCRRVGDEPLPDLLAGKMNQLLLQTGPPVQSYGEGSVRGGLADDQEAVAVGGEVPA